MSPAERIAEKSKPVASGCVEWIGGKDKDGYGKISINGKPDRAHRVSYAAHHGAIPAGLFVLHHCDNPPCVNPQHLYAGDQLQNESDKRNRGRGPAGSRNVKAKLTEDQVQHIRELLNANNQSGAQIARMFNIDKTTVSRIKLNKSWKGN